MARVEPHVVGSIVHVVKRGTRGIKIVQDKDDKRQFIRSLFYLNDANSHENWKRDTAGLGMFGRPASWLEREPLVTILAWTLLSNHFHLVLQECSEGGIAKFMQRLCGSMTKSFNKKYRERGSLFQGAYRGKTVSTDIYLRQLVWYVLVKNTMEMRPGGIADAVKDFNKAWQWGLAYPFSSFGMSVRGELSPVVADPEGLIFHICQSSEFKKDSRDFLKARIFCSEELKLLALETW